MEAMKVLDPGHRYELRHLDGSGSSVLQFVKRDGEGYPGNVGRCEGTNIQEVLRVLIDRIQYLNRQVHSEHNIIVIDELRGALIQLETRAAERHGRVLSLTSVHEISPENIPVCDKCGHIECVSHK